MRLEKILDTNRQSTSDAEGRVVLVVEGQTQDTDSSARRSSRTRRVVLYEGE